MRQFMIDGIASTFMCMVPAIVALIIAVPAAQEDAYKSGQIDAINGDIKYERVEHPDKTVTWELIDGVDDEI